EFVARQREKEEAIAEKVREWRLAEQPLIVELRQIGEQVESVWDLVNTSRPYPKAIPVLLKHLQRPYPDRVREGIARALSVPGAKIGWDILQRTFVDDPTSGTTKDAIGFALSAAADDTVLDDVIRLIRDKKNGESRLTLVPALGKSDDAKALETLKELQGDPELSFEVRKCLRLKERRKGHARQRLTIKH